MTTSTNPNQGHYSPPPLVTHATQAMPVHGAATRRKSKAPAWTAAILTSVFTAGLGFAAGTATSITETPASCLEALEHADTLSAESEQLAGYFIELADLSAQAVEAAAMWDAPALDALTLEVEALSADVDALADQHTVTYASYETARDTCRAEGGEL